MHRGADEDDVIDFVREHQDELLGELAGMVCSIDLGEIDLPRSGRSR